MACEWIGLLLPRLLVVLYKHMKNINGKESIMTWAVTVLESSEQVTAEESKTYPPHSMFSKARIVHYHRPFRIPQTRERHAM
jgi:hypothetical protein